MKKENISISSFIKEMMRRYRRLPSQLAADIGVSHTTVSRWLSCKDIPNIKSCQILAKYGGVSIIRVLSMAGYLNQLDHQESSRWPEFREYVTKKYPEELDEDIIIMIEDLIHRKRRRRYNDK